MVVILQGYAGIDNRQRTRQNGGRLRTQGGIVMRVGIYARVSTSDKDQNLDTQLLPLREFCQAQGWTVVGEFTDHASATDLRERTGWRELLDRAGKRQVDVILVFHMDRAFRSVLDAATTLERLRGWHVGLRSY